MTEILDQQRVGGIDAVAYGALDAGVSLVTNFPGFYSQDIASRADCNFTSVNEAVAFEIAYGAAVAGKRSMVTFKNVGLNVAADPFIHSTLTGVTGGMVVTVIDDVKVLGSQSRQDSRHLLDVSNMLCLEPNGPEQAYKMTKEAFNLSEKFDMPVLIRVTNQLLGGVGSIVREKQKVRPRPFVRNRKKWMVHPAHSAYQERHLAKKLARIGTFIERTNYNRVIRTNGRYMSGRNKNVGYIVCGSCGEELTENGGVENYLAIGTYPIPPEKLKRFCQEFDQIFVFEQGDAYAEEKIKALLTTDLIKGYTGNVPDNSEGLIRTTTYANLFKELKRVSPSIVFGDLGSYTLETQEALDVVLCLGASISMAVGANLAGIKRPFAIIGDAAFLHSGHSGITEALQQGASVSIVIIDNEGSGAPGVDRVPGDISHYLVEVPNRFYANARTSMGEFNEILGKMNRSEGVSALTIKYRDA